MRILNVSIEKLLQSYIPGATLVDAVVLSGDWKLVLEYEPRAADNGMENREVGK